MGIEPKTRVPGFNSRSEGTYFPHSSIVPAKSNSGIEIEVPRNINGNNFIMMLPPGLSAQCDMHTKTSFSDETSGLGNMENESTEDRWPIQEYL